MKNIQRHNRFKKDFKRSEKQGRNFNKLEKVIITLVKGESLPPHNRPHKLQGEYKDCWECHVEPDWLLIYQYDESAVYLLRLGSHSELFE